VRRPTHYGSYNLQQLDRNTKEPAHEVGVQQMTGQNSRLPPDASLDAGLDAACMSVRSTFVYKCRDIPVASSIGSPLTLTLMKFA